MDREVSGKCVIKCNSLFGENVLNMQHIIPNSKRRDYSDMSNGLGEAISELCQILLHVEQTPRPHCGG